MANEIVGHERKSKGGQDCHCKPVRKAQSRLLSLRSGFMLVDLVCDS